MIIIDDRVILHDSMRVTYKNGLVIATCVNLEFCWSPHEYIARNEEITNYLLCSACSSTSCDSPRAVQM